MIYIAQTPNGPQRRDTRDPDWWEFVDAADDARFAAKLNAQVARYLAEHKTDALFLLLRAGAARARGEHAEHARLLAEAAATTRRAALMADQLRIARKYAPVE